MGVSLVVSAVGVAGGKHAPAKADEIKAPTYTDYLFAHNNRTAFRVSNPDAGEPYRIRIVDSSLVVVEWPDGGTP